MDQNNIECINSDANFVYFSITDTECVFNRILTEFNDGLE